MSCNIPEHAQLEEELNETLEHAVQLEEELEEARLQVSHATAVAEVAGGATASEVEAMRSEMESMSKERDRYRDDYMTHRDRVTDMEAQLEDMDRKLKDQDKQRRKLDDDIELSRKMAQEERAKATYATKRLVELEKRGRSEQRDQVSLLSELQEHRERAEEMEAQLTERDALIEELSLGNQQLVELNDDLTALNETQRGEICELKGKLQDVEMALSDTQDALVVSKEVEDEYERRLDEIQGKIKLPTTEDAENHHQSENSSVITASSKKTEAEELKEEVRKLKEDVLQKDQVLEQNAQDLEKLTWQVLHGGGTEGTTMVAKSSEEIIAALKKKVKAQSDELIDEASRYEELEERMNAVDIQLSNAEAWKERYEEGYSLTDSIRYQNQLEKDIKRLESELVSRAQDIGEALDISESMDIMCQRLREEAGRPAGFLYDDLNVLKKDRKNHVEKLLSIQIDMQAEIDNLNEERLTLLEKLQQVSSKDTTITGKVPPTTLENETTTVDNVSLLGNQNQTVELQRKVSTLEQQVILRDAQIEELKTSRLHHMEEKHIPRTTTTTTNTETETETETAALKFDLQRMEDQNKNLQLLIEDLPNRLSNSGIRNPSTDINTALETLNHSLLREVQNLSTEVAGALTKGVKHDADTFMQPHTTTNEVSRSNNMVPSIAALNIEANHNQLFHANGVQSLPSRGANGEVSSCMSSASTPAIHHRFMPMTTQGRSMLKSQLRKLRLPSEDWAEEVSELTHQLVYTLEQLESRERELDEHSELMRRYEDHLKSIRAQVSALYAEYTEKSAASETEASGLRRRIQGLEEERDTLSIRMMRMSEIVKAQEQAETGDDPSAPGRLLRDLNHRVIIHEVNEQTLTRRYASVKEQYELEKARREKTEPEAIEANAEIRKRVVYLEEFKSGALERLQRMQYYIDESVPRYELEIAQRAIGLLRQRLVDLVEREADARVQLAEFNQRKGGENIPAGGHNQRHSVELDTLQQKLSETIAAKEAAEAMVVKQQELSALAMLEAKKVLASIDKGSMLENFNDLVEEVTKSQRDVATSQVEMSGVVNKLNIAQAKLTSLDNECRKLRERCLLLEERKNQAVKDSFKAKQDLADIKDTFEGGATGEEARSLLSRIVQLESQREGLRREVTRCRELADVAAEQAEALGQHRSDREEELKALQSHVSELESRSDDDIIIGSLQRKLMATKAAYKSFVRKFESMRSNLRKKSAALHVLEARLDAKDEALMNALDTHQVQVSALKKALWEVSNRDISYVGPAESKIMGQLKLNGIIIPERNNLNLINISHLTSVLEIKTTELEAAQHAKIDSEAEVSRVKMELSSLKSLVADLTIAATSTTASKTESAKFAQRIISLSNELKISKLEALVSKRAVDMSHEEKRNLELKIHSLEAIVHRMEEAKATLETQQLLGAPQSSIENAISVEVSNGGEDGTHYPIVLLTPKGKETILLDNEVSDENGISTTLRFDGDSSQAVESYVDIIGQDDLQQSASGQSIVAEAGSISTRLSNAHKQIVALTKALAASKRSLQIALNRADAAEHSAVSAERVKNILEMQLRSVSEKDCEETEERMAENNIREDQDGEHRTSSGDFDQASSNLSKNRSHLWPNNPFEAKKRNQVKEAAAMTIRTLKGLLNEKNDELDSLRKKLDVKRMEISTEEETEQSVLGQLNDRIYEKSRDSIAQLRSAAKQLSALPEITQDRVAINARFVNQLDDVSALLANKQEVIQKLEVKLRTATNRLTRSEVRCGEMIKERQRVASEFQVMAQRLDEAESRSGIGGNTERRIRELQSTVSGKETQLKKLRTALINLKKEFVQAQESAAKAAAGLEKDSRMQQCSSSQLERLSHQNEVLAREAENAIKSLKSAKQHEERKTKVLESLKHERKALQDENSGLAEKLANVQASLTMSQTELVELKKKQPGNLKKSLRGESQWSSDEKEADEAERDTENGQNRQQLVELRARVQFLSAQNASLRKAMDGGEEQGMVGEDLDSIVAEAQAAAIRAEKHQSWELEKKLRQRGDTLEKRLDDKIKEVMKLEEKLFQTSVGGGGCERATSKDKKITTAVHKFGSSSIKGKGLPDKREIPETSSVRKQGDMFQALEKARSRILELEEETQVLRRTAEVELPTEISTLSCRLRAVRMQLEESDAARILAEERLKANGSSPVDEEILQNEADTLRDEIKVLKAKQRELDSDIVERDASAMSVRFDLESAKIELDYLKRRNVELLEAINITAADSEQHQHSVGKFPFKSSGKRMSCGGQDVGGVIDAMKRVIEKLKMENEHLKRTAADAPRASEIERKLRVAKGKVAELQEETSSLKVKVQAGDESVSLLARKREQYNLVMRKLRSRESELEEVKKNLTNIEQAHGHLELEMEAAKKQILNWPAFAKGRNAEHGNSSSSSPPTLAALLRGAQDEKSNLLSRLAGMERDKERMAGRIRKAEGDQGACIISMQTEMDTLEEENEQLRSELEPFDLAFLEEIEDLKHEHAIALDRLCQYEAVAAQSVG